MTRQYTRTFLRGEKKKVLDNYINLRNHQKFLWKMIERVNNGEELNSVMKDYGYIPDPDFKSRYEQDMERVKEEV